MRWALAAAFCGLAQPSAAQAAGGPAPARLRVVASSSIVADWVGQVGGDRVALTALVGADADVHHFEARPGDLRALAAADLVVGASPALEPWLPALHRRSGAAAPLLLLADAPAAASCGSDGCAHDHGAGPDPHFWHDPTLAAAAVARLAATLEGLQPGGGFSARAQAYAAELALLDGWIARELAVIPPDRRRLVTAHAALGAYAQRYGLELVGTLAGPEGAAHAEPGTRTVLRLARLVRAQGVPAVFAEAQHPGSLALARAVADEAGARVGLLRTDSLSATGTEADSYAGLLRANTRAIVAALR